jgi:hypothetical protein
VTVGLAAALLIPAKFRYTSSIDIGVIVDEKGAVQAIEPPNTVVAKLLETYIPLATAEFASGRPDDPDIPLLSALRARDSDLVVIESTGPAHKAQDHRLLHEAVIGRLAADHRQLTLRDAQPERRLSELKSEATLLSSRLDRLDQTRKFLEGEAKQLGGAIDAATRNRAQSTSDSAGASGALALLAATQEVQQLRTRLAEIQERLYVTLPADLDALNKEIAANDRARQMHESLLASRGDGAAGPGTRALSPPVQSLAPIGKSRATIAALGAGAGLVLGILLAILAGVSEARQQPQASPRV